MSKLAVLFTGQGAQAVGMGKDFYDASSAAREVFEQAGAILGYDLQELCFEGPAAELERTDVQQPAIFTTSVAIWRALGNGRELDTPPAAMAGLSLGEYTALHVAGSVSFEDALRLVKYRGELMQAAAREKTGGMITALGLEADQVESLCREASSVGVVQGANYNCPGQVVISGENAACVRVAELIEAAGGRAIPLKVAGAFHSPLMQSAAEGLARMLAETEFSAPKIEVLANIDCEPHGDPDNIRRSLTAQLTHPVRWQASMQKLIDDGFDRFVEIGPGRVLTGLMKKINRAVPVMNISQADTVMPMVAQP